MEGFHKIQPPETRVIEGVIHKRVDSGYTLREYFSRFTPEKGPGPGWDMRWKILEEYDVNEPGQLPNEPYYEWEPVDK